VLYFKTFLYSKKLFAIKLEMPEVHDMKFEAHNILSISLRRRRRSGV